MTDPNDYLTLDTAADIAKRFGLGLPDAQALVGLANTVGEAETLAAKFTPKPSSNDFERKLRRAVGAPPAQNSPQRRHGNAGDVPALNSPEIEDRLRQALND